MWPLFSFPVSFSSMFGAEPASENVQHLPNNLAQDAHEQMDMDMPVFDSGSEGDRTEGTETTVYPSAFANFRLYVLQAELPPLELGVSAPPLVPKGHRTHLNKLAVEHAAHRVRFQLVVPHKDFRHYRVSAFKFGVKIPKFVNENEVPDTGYQLTMSTDFRLALIRPNNLQELNAWFLTVPFQTLTRIMHIAFPGLRDWEITSVPYVLQLPPGQRRSTIPDPDGEIWTTYVWRQKPPPEDRETYYWKDSELDVLGKCRVVFAIQPPWILSEADIEKFIKTKSLEIYNEYEPKYYEPYDSGERIWAKLWDTCARHRSHHWVLTSYHHWVFGAFSEGFGAGRILYHAKWDDDKPSPLMCLVYHVGVAMGMATSIVPDAPEEMEFIYHLPKDIPPSIRTVDMRYPRSDTEWEGMDEEPDFSDAPSPTASVSNYGDAQTTEAPWSPTRVIWPENRVVVSRMSRARTDTIFNWAAEVRRVRDPLLRRRFKRIPGPEPSESGTTTLSVLDAARIEQEDLPDVEETVENWRMRTGDVLATVEEDREPGEWMIKEWDGVTV